MKSGRLLPVALTALLAAAGCIANRRWLANGNQVVRVTSGDRLYLTLEDAGAADGRWSATCPDRTVELKVEQVSADSGDRPGGAGRTKVEIRVHRGFNGPAEVRLRPAKGTEKPASAGFSVMLYRETGDRAFWE